MRFPFGAGRRAGPGTIACALFLVALIPRLVTVLQLHRSGLWDYLRLDPLYYHDWAVRIAAGEWVGANTFEMTPLYAYGLGGIFHFFGHSLLLPRLLQAILGASGCALSTFLGCRLFGRASGITAGLVMAFYGPALFHEAQIMKTVVTMTLTIATATALFLSGGRKVSWLALGGLLTGATALAQENINLIIPFVLGWIALQAAPGRRIKSAMAFAGCFAAVVALATLHNFAASGDIVLVTSGGGEVFYTGNNESASGHYRPPAFVRPDPFFEHEDFRAEAARRMGRPEGSITRRESDAFWWREGLRFITTHPGQYVALLWDKLTTYFTSYERPDNYSFENFKRFVPLLDWPLPVFGVVAPFGLLGVALAARRVRETLPLLAAMTAYLVSALLFFTQSRYRMPMIPLLAVFAGHGAVSLATWAREARWRPLAMAAPVVAILGLLMLMPPAHTLAFDAQNHGILGEMYLQAGRHSEAIGEFTQAIRMLEGYAGDSAGDQHRRVTASSHFGMAMALAAETPDTGENEMLANLLAAAEGPDDDLRADALSRAGDLQSRRGDVAAAAYAWAGAVAAGAPGLPIRLRLAQALHRSGKVDEALVAAAKALDEFPAADAADRASAHYGMALILMTDRPDPARAAPHLRETLRLNPAHPRADWILSTLATLPPSAEVPPP